MDKKKKLYWRTRRRFWYWLGSLMTHMYEIAITYGLVSLLLLGGFAYITFKMTKKWLEVYLN